MVSYAGSGFTSKSFLSSLQDFSLAKADHYFQRFPRRVSREFDGRSRLPEWKLMSDERPDVQLPGEDEPGHLRLKGDIRRVASDHIFFIDANSRQIDVRVFTAFGMRKQQDLPRASN